MDNFNKLANIIFTSAKDRPKITVFLTTLAFLVFVLYGALFIASDGLWMFALYVALAMGAFIIIATIVLHHED